MKSRADAVLIPERFLRQLWKHTLFETSALQTADGKSVDILSPGALNMDGGPDFNSARVRIGGVLYRGDIELHKSFAEWKAHRHHLDPKYNGVILHVVLHGKTSDAPQSTRARRIIPLLILEPYLTASYHPLWEKMILGERAERLDTIKCFEKNGRVETPLLERWLNKLAVERIELKVRRFEDRLRDIVIQSEPVFNEPHSEYGEVPFGVNPEDLPPPGPTLTARDFARVGFWEQLLYEGILEALGYSKNQEPFKKLAQNLTLRELQRLTDGLNAADRSRMLEGLIFGAAGLLSEDGPSIDHESRTYLNGISRAWKSARGKYKGAVLEEAEWQFFRLRPDNFPTIRAAAAAKCAARFLQRGYFKEIIQTLKSTDVKVKQKFGLIESLIMIDAEGFWSNHYRFGASSGKKLAKLIGASRAGEIILNVVIPVALLYARTFKDKEVRAAALGVFEQCSPPAENSVTRTIDKQLLKGKFALDSAMAQQGALQLYKLYCVEERCAECAVGKEVFTT